MAHHPEDRTDDSRPEPTGPWPCRGARLDLPRRRRRLCHRRHPDPADVARGALDPRHRDARADRDARRHPREVDDRHLFTAITAGDRDAFRALVEREQAPVFRACYRILGRVAEAEDVAQESFVIAYRAIGTWRGDGPLGAWLGRIATRQALRRLGQRRETVPLESVGGAYDVSARPPPPS